MKKKLGEIFEIGSGGTPSKSHPEYYGGDIPWVKTGDLKAEYLYEVEDYITEDGLNNSSAKMYDVDTVLIAMYGATIGATSILKFPACTNQACAAFRKSKEVLPEYLYYFLRSKKAQFVKDGVGGAQPNISARYLKKVEMEILSKNEQQAVVDALDKVAGIIAYRQQELQKLDDLIKARFVEMFVGKDYPLVPLDDLSLGKGEYGAQSASTEYVPGRPRYVRITDINDDGSLNDDVVSSANIEDDEQYKLSYGDFMFARMGATVGKTYAYKTGNQIFAGYLIRYRLNLEKIIPEYLYAYTRLDEYKSWVLLNQSGAAQPGINAKKYGSLQIPVAPLTEQTAFENFVKQVDKSKFEVQKSLDEAQLLFDSLMQEYFG